MRVQRSSLRLAVVRTCRAISRTPLLASKRHSGIRWVISFRALNLSRKPPPVSRACWVHNRVWLAVVDGDGSEPRAGPVAGVVFALDTEFRCGEPNRRPAVGHGQLR